MLTSVFNYLWYMHFLLCFIYFVLKWSLIYIAVSLIGITAFNICRIFKIKLGRKIHINGRKGILITGATSGFGLLIAKHFYKLGFSVFACYYNEKELGYEELLELSSRKNPTENELEGEKLINRPYLFLIPMDVTSKKSVVEAHKKVEALLDKYNMELYCVINNAGISKVGPFEWVDQASIDQSLSTNLGGAMMVARQFMLRIIQSKGKIINVGSGVHIFSTGGLTVYGSTKSALVHFSGALNEDLKPYGASCHCLLPGNFIIVSNIIYSRIKCLQESEKKLTDEERAFYRTSIDEHFKETYGLLRLKLNLSNEDPDKVSAIYQIEIPDFVRKKRSVPTRKLSFFEESCGKILQLLDGSACDLEGSGVIEGFEQAVCLKSPPRYLYPGSLFYTYISGPSTEYLSPAICSLIAKKVVNNVVQKNS